MGTCEIQGLRKLVAAGVLERIDSLIKEKTHMASVTVERARSQSKTPIEVFNYLEPPEDSYINGWNGPGWYWFDESYGLHGPYETADQALVDAEKYILVLTRV